MANVTIQGTLSPAVGLGSVVGAIRVVNSAFTDVNLVFHPAGSTVVSVAEDGSYDFTLAANAESSPQSFYVATYFLTGNTQYTEYWIVPNTTATVTIAQIRTNQVAATLPFQVPVGQLYSATGNIGDVLVNTGGQGYAPATIQSVYPFQFTSESTIVVPGASHGQGTSLIIQVYDASGNQADPSITVDPVLGDVAIVFNAAHSGFGFIYGGISRSLPNYAATFFNQSSITITQSQHRFATANLAVEIYDPSGVLISSAASISVSPTFDVTATFGYPISGKIIVIGCLGTTPGVAIAPPASGNTLTGSASIASGTILDGDVVAAQTSISVVGAAVGSPVSLSCTPPLPTGLMAYGKVTNQNVVTVEIWNLSGEAQNPGTALYSATVVASEGSAQMVTGNVGDGTVLVLGTKITLTGAAVGVPVGIASTPPLPTGVIALGKVTAANTVTVEVWNLSGSAQSPGAVVYSASLLS